MENAMNRIYEYVTTYGLDIIGAVLIFVIGRWIAKLLAALLGKGLSKTTIDSMWASLIQNTAYFAMLALVVIAALAKLGVQTASLVVVIGAAGLAIGLALQGSLSNVASGALILLFRPFKGGDFVEIGDVKGTVKAIQIFSTILDTPDNVRVTIPNAKVTSGNIFNYTANPIRRIDLTVEIAYENDLRKAQGLLEELLSTDGRVLKEPSAVVAPVCLGQNGMDFAVQPWCRSEDYAALSSDLVRRIKLSFDQNGITIPYPQREIHVRSHPAEELVAAGAHGEPRKTDTGKNNIYY